MPVRALTPAERHEPPAGLLEVLLGLNNAAVPAVGELDTGRLAHLLREAPIALLVHSEGGQGQSPDPGSVVGFCLVMGPGADYQSVNYLWFAERYERFIYLDRVVVDPAHHGRGHGRAMYEMVADEAMALLPEAEVFCLEVNLRPRNEQSLGFHAALGFTEVGQQETPYGARVSMLTRDMSRG